MEFYIAELPGYDLNPQRLQIQQARGEGCCTAVSDNDRATIEQEIDVLEDVRDDSFELEAETGNLIKAHVQLKQQFDIDAVSIGNL